MFSCYHLKALFFLILLKIYLINWHELWLIKLIPVSVIIENLRLENSGMWHKIYNTIITCSWVVTDLYRHSINMFFWHIFKFITGKLITRKRKLLTAKLRYIYKLYSGLRHLYTKNIDSKQSKILKTLTIYFLYTRVPSHRKAQVLDLANQTIYYDLTCTVHTHFGHMEHHFSS